MEDMVVAVGEAALSAAFEALFRKISSQDVVKYASRNKVRSEVNRWEKELLKMNCVLDNAEERQMSEAPIKKWMDELRDLAYDVEDILNEFSTEVMREKVKAENEASPSKVRKLISACCSSVSPRDIKFNASLGSKMEEITQRFERLAKEKEDLKFIESISRIPSGAVKGKLETTSLPEPHVFGREAERETLVRELLSDDYNREPVSAVAIVGMGGLGKTTMAQLLYDDDRVKTSFETKAWVCVSDEFEALKITAKIIEGFTSYSCNDKDLGSAQEKLKVAVKGKKFLLILDDLWNEDYMLWELLIRPLAAGGLGSRVLITTRNEGVAATAGSVFKYPLNKLNDKDCLSVLARHALGEDDFSGHPMLKDIGEEIAKKCDGLPLAAKAIGGLLRGKPNPKEWSKVLQSNMWELPGDKCPILPALRVSYRYLPPHLKPCFAYCAIFPKDYAFDKDDLILWWKGEGFLEQSTDFMELGNEYFQDLLSRSFFQPSAYSKFVMHDLMNDLAMWISGGICLHLPKDKEIDSGLKFENLRHISFVTERDEDPQRFEKFSSSTSRLRTFIAFSQTTRHNRTYHNNDITRSYFLDKMKCLKVLCLRSYGIGLPDSISKLKLLCHLDMSFTNIQLLPESITDLWNLQILKLNGCCFLIQLPREIRKLINLQIFDINNTIELKEMPSGIERLTNLQILPKFIVGKNRGLRLNELKRLSLIQGELSISRLEHVVDIQDAKDADLKAKKGLVSLKFEWSPDLISLEEEKHEQILAELQPHTSIKSLEIKGYNGKHLPQWVGYSTFTNLETLILSDCKSASSLLPFRELSSLKTLRIKCSNLTDLTQQLPSLECLRIEGCSNLKNLPNKLPLLAHFSITECSSLTDLPNELPSLTELRIKECSNLTNLPNQLPLLTLLFIDECSYLTNFPNHLPLLDALRIDGCSNLTNLTNELPLLRDLLIERCLNLTNLPNQLPSLQVLTVRGCSNLTNLPNKLPLLRNLTIEGCSNLINLTNEFPSLEYLTLKKCSNLTNLPNQLHSLTSLCIEGCSNLVNLSCQFPLLSILRVRKCSNWTNLPNELPSLEYLSIQECLNLSNLPNQLPLLRYLSIERCSNLTNLPNQFPSLETLAIEGCSNLTNLPNVIPLLRDLRIEGCSYLTNLPNQLPSLTMLKIESCSNMTNLPVIPLLKNLRIKRCSNLTNLPNQLPLLTDLFIEECSNLTNFSYQFPSLATLSIKGCSNWKSLPNQFPSLEDLSIDGLRIKPDFNQ